MVRISVATLSLILAPAAPLYAQDTEASEEEYVPAWQRQLDEQPEVPCDEFDPPLSDEQRAELETNPVTDQYAFDCERDWAYVEDGLSKLLPEIGEPAYGDYEPPEDIEETIASRYLMIVYGSVRIMRSVRCDFVHNPRDRWTPKAVGGTARYVRFAGWTDEDDPEGDWQVALSAADCDFFYEMMDGSDPDRIVHDKPYDSGPGNQIIIANGMSFTEFLDTNGNYSIKLRPGISQPAGSYSERAEASQRLMLDYFTHRARSEGERRELPESLRAQEED